MNNKEIHVSLKTARLLKQAGFNVPCHEYYMRKKSWVFLSRDKRDHNALPGDAYSRPTMSLALRWLLYERHIHLYADFDPYWQKWYYVIRPISNSDCCNLDSGPAYLTCEHATEAGLQQALRLAIA